MKALLLFLFLSSTAVYISAQEVSAEKRPTCPSISVTGPPMVPQVNTPVKFTALVVNDSQYRTKYTWSISGGEIITGQGTLEVTAIQTEPGGNFTVTFEVSGLPASCVNFASETAPVCECATPLQIDEFTSKVSEIDRDRLKAAVLTLKNKPNDQLHILEYYASDISPFDIREKVRRETKYIEKELGLEEDHFEIVVVRSEKTLTKIFLVPPGADTPQP